MKLLLDSHVFVWLIEGDARLGKKTEQTLRDTANWVDVSIFSLFELAVKAASGKMEKYNAELVEDNLQTMGLGLLKNASVLTKYKVFNPKNKDPFDNALIATAVEYGVTLVTADSKILSTKVEGLKLMDARI